MTFASTKPHRPDIRQSCASGCSVAEAKDIDPFGRKRKPVVGRDSTPAVRVGQQLGIIQIRPERHAGQFFDRAPEKCFSTSEKVCSPISLHFGTENFSVGMGIAPGQRLKFPVAVNSSCGFPVDQSVRSLYARQR
jgi:hypothetical protein